MDLKECTVSFDKLRWHCDPSLFQFECTKDLSPLNEFIGQDRAIRAIEFGLNMRIEILTDVSAGEKREDGTFPEESIHGLVSSRLKQMAEKLTNERKAAL